MGEGGSSSSSGGSSSCRHSSGGGGERRSSNTSSSGAVEGSGVETTKRQRLEVERPFVRGGRHNRCVSLAVLF
jgi:hypothetical protein